MSTEHGGIVVPISNPEGVVPLLDLAFAATQPDEPTPHVLLMTRRAQAIAQEAQPGSAALTSVQEFLTSRNASLASPPTWTDDPATDIVATAQARGARWILMGSHRPELTPDYRGGTVGDVLRRVEGTGIKVAVLIYGPAHPQESVIAVVDYSSDGESALEISVRIAAGRKCKMRTLMVPREGRGPDEELHEMVKRAHKKIGGRPRTDVLSERSAARLAHQTPGSIVVIASRLTEHLGLPLDSARGDSRRVVVVHSED
ncbi:MAG TPA: hypothetical protein VMA09_20465 [Candidatus Binataceae bacterium]|nr:hypothetical protein [Candidatus Binataceae bacterium]